MQHLSSSTGSRFLRQALAGAAFLGLVALVSLPTARGAGPIGWGPLWLPGMPLVALAALMLADLRERVREPAARGSTAAVRRRARPPQARRRAAARPGPSRRRAAA